MEDSAKHTVEAKDKPFVSAFPYPPTKDWGSSHMISANYGRVANYYPYDAAHH